MRYNNGETGQMAAKPHPSSPEKRILLISIGYTSESHWFLIRILKQTHQWSSHLLLVTAVAKERAGLIEHPSTGIMTRWSVRTAKGQRGWGNRETPWMHITVNLNQPWQRSGRNQLHISTQCNLRNVILPTQARSISNTTGTRSSRERLEH